MKTPLKSILGCLQLFVLLIFLTASGSVLAQETFYGKTVDFGANLLKKMHLFDAMKPIFVAMVSNPNLKEINISGTVYPVQRHLGSGGTGDAFLIQIDGEIVVVKVANRKKDSPKNMLAQLPVNELALSEVPMNVPKVLVYDPEGKWIVSEFIQGENAAKVLREKGYFTYEQKETLRELYEQSAKIYELRGINIDYAPDNIIFKNGEAYLVDLGPLSKSTIPIFNIPFDELVKGWEKSMGRKAQKAQSEPPAPANACRAIRF